MIPVHDLGSGPALVLIPGLAATARFFEPLAADLSRDHRVIVAELPGHGRNTAHATPSLAQAASQLADTIEALGLRDVTLLGWSLGATVCYQLLSDGANAAATQNISALISVEQTPRLTVTADTETQTPWPHAAFGGLDDAGARQLEKEVAADPAAFAQTLVTASFAAGTEPDTKLFAELVAQAQTCDPAAVSALLTDILAHDFRDALTRLTLPTLFVHGARSQVYPTGVGSWLEQAVPGSRLVTFEASGHLPFLEEQDRFAAVIRDFVSTRRNSDG